MSNQQKGLAPIILILLATVGIIVYILASSSLPFKNGLFSLLYPKPSSQAAPPSESVPDEILIKFKPGVGEVAKDNIIKAHGLEIKETIPGIEVALAKVPQQAKDRLIEALNKNPNIEYAEPNFIVEAQLTPNDTYFPNQWALPKISAPQGWDISTGSQSAVIAVLDTGIDTAHEDLLGKYLDSPTPDDNGHGTLVSGVAAAASNNGKGVAGVCWLCPILSVKILNSTGSGTNWNLDHGIIYAADNGAKVINMSLGASCFSTDIASCPQDVQNAVNYAWNKGVVLVAASGNSGSTQPVWPAALNNVVAVGMTDPTDTRNSNSTYGPWLDVVAPGSGVLTTRNGGSYGTASGTSLASPHVAALAGLIFSANSGLTNTQVVDIITSTADDLGPTGRDDEYGWGRINVAKALEKATNTTPQPTPTPTPIPTPTPTPTPIPDTTSPTVSVTTPADGSVVSGSVNIQANASDNVGLSTISIFIDGSVVTVCSVSGTTSSCSYTWDSTAVANGNHTIQAKALDSSSNLGESTIITVNVNNTIATPTPNPNPSDTTPPTVSIIQPLDGTIVPRNTTVTIQASASDNVAVSKVEFLVNNSLKCTSTVTPYTCSWKVPGKRGATYTITAKAYDSSNNTNSSTVSVRTQ